MRHTYYIDRKDDYDLTPEETLADASSGHSVVERPIGQGVFRVFYAIGACAILLLTVQAFRLQVFNGKNFALIADQSRFHRYTVPSLRGIIYDVKGNALVQNMPVFDLVVVRSELLAKSNGTGYLMLDNLLSLPTGGIKKILEENQNNGIFIVSRDIDKDAAIRIQTAKIPGLYVVPFARRDYIGGPSFAHMLGYTSQISPEELKHDTDNLYEFNDRVGRLGVEASYEEQLHGESQSIILQGSSTTELTSKARSGDTLTLYADKDIQNHLFESVTETFRSAGVHRGAAIVQDVHTGAILGMVSFPAFDPNIFEQGGNVEAAKRVQGVLRDADKPLFNRAISGLYAPGSTIKPLYALAGLKEKLIDVSTSIYADGAIQVQSEIDPSVQYTFRDWKVHGWTDVRKAIAWSVDVYFYALGGGYQNIRGLGIDRIERYLKEARVDQTTGIDLPGEQHGFVPSRQWKKETKGEPWFVGDTYNISIGQGDLLVTPVWLASYVSAIANGGNIMKPLLAKEIRNGSTGAITEFKPSVMGRLPFSDGEFQIVRQGMRQTITDGTAQRLKDLSKPVAAKTGTAQMSGQKLNSLFIVYGPYEKPEIAMIILVENITESQSLGVQVAQKFFSWYFQN